VVDRDVVSAKLAVIERCLARIADVQGPRRGRLEPLDVEDITALNLLRAVQAGIDLAAHVVADEEYGLPADTAEVYTMLEQHGVLDADLAGRLRKMVGFRNIAVHEYQQLDPAIVRTIVDRHLGDLRTLGARVIEHYGLSRSRPGA
jgi:uncharacterized protein YutE (UPF0331/DUF86 family)